MPANMAGGGGGVLRVVALKHVLCRLYSFQQLGLNPSRHNGGDGDAKWSQLNVESLCHRCQRGFRALHMQIS
jgi:hypothetical protein